MAKVRNVLASLGSLKDANRARSQFDDQARKFADEEIFPPADVRPAPTEAISLLIRLLGQPADTAGASSDAAAAGASAPSAGASSDATASGASSDGDIFALVHVPAERDSAFVFVFNPSTEVERGATLGGLVDEAGWPVYVAVAEEFLGRRVDHVMAVDFTAVSAIIDQLGSVAVYSRSEFTAGGTEFVVGTNHLDGRTAEIFAEADPIDDAGQTRTRNQRALLRSLVAALNFGKLAKSPQELIALLGHVAASSRSDSRLTTGELGRLAAGLRQVSQDDIVAITVPTKSERGADGRVFVRFDEEAVPALRGALAGADPAEFVRGIAELGY